MKKYIDKIEPIHLVMLLPALIGIIISLF